MRWMLGIGGLALVAIVGFLVWELRADPPADETGEEPAVPASRRARKAPEREARAPAIPPDRAAPLERPRLAADDPAPPGTTAPAPAREPAPSLATTDAAPADIQAERVRAMKKLYKARDYEAAREEALAMIREYPDEVEGYLIAVLSSCAMGDAETAQQYYAFVDGRRARRTVISGCKMLGMELKP